MLWMAVTADKYELPLCVEDTQENDNVEGQMSFADFPEVMP